MPEIHLTEEEQAFIDTKLRTGAYRSVEEVVRAGLALLDVHDRETEALRLSVKHGIDDADAGRVHEYASATDLLKDIRQQAGESPIRKPRVAKGHGH
jgi:antitoxin ParD1/3/4